MNDREFIREFAEKHGLTVEFDGEVGFGRPCVGLKDARENYVDYNPYSYAGDDYLALPEFEDDRFDEIAPEDAYHKHDCVAVLVHNDKYDPAVEQLADWCRKLDELGVEVASYSTGATGVQAMISGVTGYSFKVKEK